MIYFGPIKNILKLTNMEDIKTFKYGIRIIPNDQLNYTKKVDPYVEFNDKNNAPIVHGWHTDEEEMRILKAAVKDTIDLLDSTEIYNIELK